MTSKRRPLSLLRRASRPAAGALLMALLGLPAAGCSGEGGGPFQNVTIDPARERVNALEADTDGAEQAVNAFYAAWDRKDADALAALFTSRAEVYLEGARVVPAAEFVQEQAAAWGSRGEARTEVALRGVTLARPYGWAKARVRTEIGDGPAESRVVTFGLEQRGDAWLISHLQISSADSAPAA